MAYLEQLHTHTMRCKHASGDVLDYARVATAAGCKTLGMSDHAPFPDGGWPSVRMSWDELDDYEAQIRLANATFPELQVILGLEIEWDPQLDAWYQDELMGKRGYQYLIGAAHYYRSDGVWTDAFSGLDDARNLAAFTDHCVAMIASGHYAFIAHPDLVGCSYGGREWDADCAAHANAVCAAAADCGVPLELNGYGLRKPWIPTPSGGTRPRYPWDPFWRIAAEHKCTVVRNSDAHRPEDVCAGHDELAVLIDTFGLQETEPFFTPKPDPTPLG